MIMQYSSVSDRIQGVANIGNQNIQQLNSSSNMGSSDNESSLNNSTQVNQKAKMKNIVANE
jgi:hypothetical protein